MKTHPFSIALLGLLFAVVPGLEARHEPKQTPTRSPAITFETYPNAGPQRVTLRLVRLDRKTTTLRVLDMEKGETVAGRLSKAGAIAGVNGGYFHPDRRPLGLVVSDGVRLHRMERSKLLSGLLVVTPQRAMLLRRTEYREGRNTREALQAGPFLVDRGKAVAGLNETKAAERTVVLADRRGVCALLTTDSITLADLGRLLATPDLFPGLVIERALNLDGGSSTALWVDALPRPYSRPEWKGVRNAVGVLPR